MATTRFPFRFRTPVAHASRLVGVHPGSAYVDVDELDVPNPELRIRFGPWRLETPRSNLDCVHITGPYSTAKVIGPPRLSFVDSGITFATCTEQGVCICFKERVPAADPFGLRKHEAATVTVDDIDGLVAALGGETG